jgi:hypothetical protein
MSSRGAVYSASKSYVLPFSAALRFDCEDRGVSLMTLCAGATDSNFRAVAATHANAESGDVGDSSELVAGPDIVKLPLARASDLGAVGLLWDWCYVAGEDPVPTLTFNFGCEFRFGSGLVPDWFRIGSGLMEGASCGARVR